jgi:hypothetical protein
VLRYSGRERMAGALLALVAATAACGSDGGGPDAGAASPPPKATPTATASQPADPRCAEVAAKAADVGAALTSTATGTQDPAQLRTAVQNLLASLDAALRGLAPQIRQEAARLRAAAEQLAAALTAQPVDAAAVRQAGQQTLDALGSLLQVCAATGTPVASPS